MIEHKSGQNLKVGIIIPTMNRSEFIIRQLNYYSSVNCPHTIYIGDSSNPEHSEKIKETIYKLGNQIRVIYEYIPDLNDREATQHLLSITKESYACFSGDDDYQIPDSLTKCAEFLENNPNYSSASGYAVSFRLKNKGAYGELDRLADYPRRQIELATAAERLLSFMVNYYVPAFSVNRTNQMLKSWEEGIKTKDKSFGSEIIPTSLSLIVGKSAILNCLGFVRQIHDSHYGLPNTYDWVISPDWHSSYKNFEVIISENISIKDGISLQNASEITKQAFWAYLKNQLTKEYRDKYSREKSKKQPLLKKLRPGLTNTFPFLKTFYRTWIKKPLEGRTDLHYKVLQKSSSYYKDFQPVLDSFTEKLTQ